MAGTIGVHAAVAGSAVTSVTTAARDTQTSGSTIALFGHWGTETFTSFGDNNSTSFDAIGSELNASSHRSRMARKENASGRSGHTFTLTLGSSGAPTLYMVELLGCTSSSYEDFSSRDDTSSPYTLPSGLTPSQAEMILVVGFGGNSGSNPATHAESGISGSTLQDEFTNGTTQWTGGLYTAITSSGGTYNPSITETGASSGHVWMATFKVAPTGAPVRKGFQPRKAKRYSGIRRNFDLKGWFNVRADVKGWFWRGWSAAASPNVTLALTGVASTATAGTVAPANSIALTGAPATAATGNVTASQPITGVAATAAVSAPGVTHDQALTGNSSTSATGTIAPANSVALTGAASTAAVNAPGVTHDQALTGASSASSTGTVVPGLTIALTGVSATCAVGSVTVATTDVTVAITGVAASTAAGTVAPASSIALTGTAGSGATGTVVPGTAKAITGSASTASVGTVSPAASPALTGTSITGGTGTVAPASSIPLTGSTGSGQVGNVTYTAGVVVSLTGVQATGEVGSVVVPVFADTSPYRTTARPAAGRLGSNPDAVQAARLGNETDTAAEARLGSTPDAVDAGRLGSETATPTAARLGARTT